MYLRLIWQKIDSCYTIADTICPTPVELTRAFLWDLAVSKKVSVISEAVLPHLEGKRWCFLEEKPWLAQNYT